MLCLRLMILSDDFVPSLLSLVADLDDLGILSFDGDFVVTIWS